MDLVLEQFLAADNAGEEERLQELMSQAQPIIRRVVAARLHDLPQEVEDICSDARLELLLIVRRLKADPSANPIADFPGYVATVAVNACHRYFRSRNPRRARLRNQIRYLLTNDSRFAMQVGPSPKCGLTSWDLNMPHGTPPVPASIAGERDLARLVQNIFEQHGRPIRFDALVDLVANIWNVPSRDTVGFDDIQFLEKTDTSQSKEAAMDQRRFIEKVWAEIRELPRNQRVALLLNSRDSRGHAVLQLVQLTGIAFFPEIAAVLELSVEELAKLWNQLPLDDNSIAARLMCTRQQVINFRMTARKRLTNRLQGSQ